MRVNMTRKAANISQMPGLPASVLRLQLLIGIFATCLLLCESTSAVLKPTLWHACNKPAEPPKNTNATAACSRCLAAGGPGGVSMAGSPNGDIHIAILGSGLPVPREIQRPVLAAPVQLVAHGGLDD